MSTFKEITSDQKVAIEELKETIGKEKLYNLDDRRLFKFLVARKFDVSAAAEMLKKHLYHWNKFGIDQVLATDFVPDEKFKYFLTSTLGFDKEGNIIRIMRVGQSDLKGIILSHPPPESFRYAAYILEKDKKEQQRKSEELGKENEDKQIYLIDLQGLPWRTLFSRPLADRFLYLLHVYEANYPESLKTVYIANAPSFFNLIYNFIKKVLPSEIISKIEVLGNSKECEGVLTQVMDPAILPAYLGGTRTDENGDPTCSSMFSVPPGTQVPEELYAAQENWLDNDSEAKRVTIANQGTFRVDLEVTEENTVIIWDFKTVGNDLGMGLFLKKTGDAEPQVIIPNRRVDCHRYIESGRYQCHELGLYVLLFDNSYSWFAKKELIYKAKILSSEEAEKLDQVVIN